MITKLISSKAVVAKVIADLNLQEKDMRMSDITSWIGEIIKNKQRDYVEL